jgi:hypothetical protein
VSHQGGNREHPLAYRKIIEIGLYGVETRPQGHFSIRRWVIGMLIGPDGGICCYILKIPREHSGLELYDEIVVFFRMIEHTLKHGQFFQILRVKKLSKLSEKLTETSNTPDSTPRK